MPQSALTFLKKLPCFQIHSPVYATVVQCHADSQVEAGVLTVCNNNNVNILSTQ